MGATDWKSVVQSDQNANMLQRIPRRCVSTASKSEAIRPTRPLCKQHGVGYARNSVKANSTSEEP